MARIYLEVFIVLVSNMTLLLCWVLAYPRVFELWELNEKTDVDAKKLCLTECEMITLLFLLR